jgi:hypothetical protein
MEDEAPIPEEDRDFSPLLHIHIDFSGQPTSLNKGFCEPFRPMYND